MIQFKRSASVRRRWQAIAVVAALVSQTEASRAAPPNELHGNPVIVSWSEAREQRTVGEENWRQAGGTETLSMYVSDAGRVFSRHSYSTRGGAAERAGQISGQSTRSVNFNGHSLLVIWPWGGRGGGATRITADFDGSFSGCNAQVTRGKESAGTVIRVYSGIIKHDVDIRSVQISGISCSIRAGNVFAN